MKLKISIAVVLVFAVLCYLFSGIAYEHPSVTNELKSVNTALRVPQTQIQDRFLVGVMHSYFNDPNHSYYDEAGLNTTHAYTTGTLPDPNNQYADPVRHTPKGTYIENDYLYSPVPSTAIGTVLQNMYAHNQSKFLWMRPKIEWLAYGKSSTYQAEEISQNDDYWFYSFQIHNGQSIPDNQWNNGNMVLQCVDNTYTGSNAGYVLKRLKANSEQCNRIIGDAAANYWQGSNECNWIIKPKIRADKNYINNNTDDPICRVEVYNQWGNKFKEVLLRARNFKVDRDPYNQPTYNGEYIEKFNFNSQLYDSTLNYRGDWGDKFGFAARGNRTIDEENNCNDCNKVDIQLYWYDNCPMWVDYIKVDDDIASDLLADPPNPRTDRYNQWIQEEVDAVMNAGTP